MAMKTFTMTVQLLGLVINLLQSEESHAATASIPCPPQSTYSYKSPCYNNCDNLNATICTEEPTHDCTCNEGFVYQSKDSKVCVPVDSCQLTCPEHSQFRKCYREPRVTCNTLGIKFQPSETCMSRCVCDEGYVLSVGSNPQCVKEKTCPKFTRN